MAGLVVCTGRFLSNSEEGKDGNKHSSLTLLEILSRYVIYCFAEDCYRFAEDCCSLTRR